MLSPATTRALTRTVSHLVLAGDNPLAPPGRSAAAAAPSSRQAVSNPSPAQVPLSTWLASVGRETDVERGYQIKHVAGGAGHQLVSYRNYEGFGTIPSLACGPRPHSHADPLPRPDRIFALGRNEAGQLGVGFASQEGTRALVEGFEGDQVLAVRAGVQSSYILVRDGGAHLFILASTRSVRAG
jgi:hypothetical protein